MRIEEIIARLFRVGFIMSIVIMSIGLLIVSASNESNIFQSTMTLRGLIYGNPVAIITFGILILMIVPIISILALFVFFLRKSNKFFSVITFYVLLFILSTIILLMMHLLS